jgi:glycosyltransferase involved in cell wall biosynthesis
MTSTSDPSIGFVSTFPPTVCGIASYTASLVKAIAGKNPDGRLGVVSLQNVPTAKSHPPVVFDHRTGDRASLRTAAAILNMYDTVSIQHEFGIYGGRDGNEVLDLMSDLTVPAAVTLHTVLSDPTPNQRSVTEAVCDLATRIVVMSETAASRLVDRYGVEPHRISVIAHGADRAFAGPSLSKGGRPLLMTWGLIGPGKGFEWAIQAFAGLTDMRPLPRYLIAGATHPNVRRESGEDYRSGLVSLTDELGLNEVIEFDDRYFARPDLARLVRSADLVVLPYQSAEQVTSGVLVEAIAASKPVVASPFPHAVELLTGGAGAIVPFNEPDILGSTLRQILTDSSTRSRMTERAGQLATGWYWPTIGGEFIAMMSSLAASDDPNARLIARHRVAG